MGAASIEPECSDGLVQSRVGTLVAAHGHQEAHTTNTLGSHQSQPGQAIAFGHCRHGLAVDHQGGELGLGQRGTGQQHNSPRPQHAEVGDDHPHRRAGADDHDLAGADALLSEPCGHVTGAGVELPVGDGFAGDDQGRAPGFTASRGREHLRQRVAGQQAPDIAARGHAREVDAPGVASAERRLLFMQGVTHPSPGRGPGRQRRAT